MTNLEREIDALLDRAGVSAEQSMSPMILACSPDLDGVARTAMNESLKEMIHTKGFDEYDYIRMLIGKLDLVTSVLSEVLIQRDKLIDELAGEALENGNLCDYCVHAFESVHDEPCRTCVQHDPDDPGLFTYDLCFKEDEEPIDVLAED